MRKSFKRVLWFLSIVIAIEMIAMMMMTAMAMPASKVITTCSVEETAQKEMAEVKVESETKMIPLKHVVYEEEIAIEAIDDSTEPPTEPTEPPYEEVVVVFSEKLTVTLTMANQPQFAVDEDEVYLMGQLMMAEAGGIANRSDTAQIVQDFAEVDTEEEAKEAAQMIELVEMLFVGITAENREKSEIPDFKNVDNLTEVISQSGQYPQTWKRIRNGLKPTDLALEAARLLKDGSIVAIEITYNGETFLLGDDILWQTGFTPNWGTTEVAFATPWHKYSRLK